MSTSTNKAGDIIEDLISLKVDRQKTAIKKIISAMTIGRDVSKLFPHVVKCIITPNLELKKLVYKISLFIYHKLRSCQTFRNSFSS